MTGSQLPPFPNSSASPMPHPTTRPEQQWLDPQFRGQSSTHTSGTAVGNGFDKSMMLGPKEVETLERDSRRGDDTEEEIGAWSL